MIRIIAENILVFLSPTLIYIAWVAFRSDEWPGLFRVLSNAPLVWLFLAGAAMMLLALVVFSSSSGGKPGQAYDPATIQDGHVVPGHLRDQ